MEVKCMKSNKHIACKLSVIAVILLIVMALVSCDILSGAVESIFDGGFKLAPQIDINEIDFEITGIGSEMRGYDNFPSITAFVRPTDPDTGALITGLVRADFFDVIDDNGEARPIEVFARGSATTVNKMADIVFIIDTTGSMTSEINTVVSKAQSFADTLAASDLDYRLGFITFGDDIRKNTLERLAPTSNATTFKDAVEDLTTEVLSPTSYYAGPYGGADGPENQIDAIDYARAASTGSNPAGSFQQDMGFLYRDSAARIFILMTDVGYHTPASPGDVLDYYSTGVWNTVDQEIAKLNASGVNVYVVAPDTMEYERLADETGGDYFTMSEDPSAIIDTIGEAITTMGDYMITFMTNDLSESKLHNVRIAVHTRLGAAQDTATYTSPATVDFDRARRMVEEYDARFLE